MGVPLGQAGQPDQLEQFPGSGASLRPAGTRRTSSPKATFSRAFMLGKRL